MNELMSNWRYPKMQKSGTKHRIVILNGTCLGVIQEHQDWLSSFADQVEIVADPAFGTAKESELEKVLENAHALILPASVRNFPLAAHMERFKKVRVLSIAASGYDWLDVEAATRNGIVATFAPVSEGAEVVADMTMGLMLAVARQIPFHHQAVREGGCQRGMGVSLWEKTLGIVGLGNIGRAVARRAAGFDMKMLAVDPYPDMDFVRQHGIELVTLNDLLRRSDFISLHVRLNNQTRHMIGKRELALMKPSAFLVNAARQELVDEVALTDAIVNHRIAGIAMDDPPTDKHSPLLGLPNVVCTPHLGNRAIEGVRAVFKCAIGNAVKALRDERPEFVVNPAVYEFSLRR